VEIHAHRTSPQTTALDEGDIFQPTPTFGNPQSINFYALHDLFTTLPFFAPFSAQSKRRASVINLSPNAAHRICMSHGVDSVICQR